MSASWFRITLTPLLFCLVHSEASFASTKKTVTSKKQSVSRGPTAKTNEEAEEIVDPLVAEIEKDLARKKADPKVKKAATVQLWSLKDPPPEPEEPTPREAPKVAMVEREAARPVATKPTPLVRGRLSPAVVRESANASVPIRIISTRPARTYAASQRARTRAVRKAPAARPAKEFKIALRPAPAKSQSMLAAKSRSVQRVPASASRK